MPNDSSWPNPWKLASLGLALVAITALTTGLVVANWPAHHPDVNAVTAPPPPPPPPAPSQVTTTTPASRPHVTPWRRVPTRATVDACHRYAASRVERRDKSAEIVKDGAIGAVAGAVLGAATGAIAGGGEGAGKGAAIGGLVGAGGGSLYGLNQSQKRDRDDRDAYARCMQARGYTG